MMTRYFFPVVSILVTIFLISCSQPSGAEIGNGGVIKKEGKIFIEDRTGKQWDVTHAVEKYGFKAEQFQFGLGPFAIQPIMNPNFIEPGDPEYPAPNENFLVIGTTLNGDTRAYPINVLSRHEIANEKFDRTFVAVGY